MKITVIRSGGFAGLTRRWVVIVDDQDDAADWEHLVENLPWDARSSTPPQPDRYVYRIRVSRRQITLPEQQLAGPWRQLVDRVLDTAEPEIPRTQGGGHTGAPRAI